MAKKGDLAARLIELGHDPLIAMVRIANAAETSNNLVLAAKVNGDLLEYIAPKLKSVEVSLDPDTLDALTPEQRRDRIRELVAQVGGIPAVPTSH